MVYDLLPVRHVVLEIGAFDTQKINNPDISGKEYQEGDQMGFRNTREYVLYRDNHTCQHCKGKSGDKILNVHHIETRKVGGNAPSNLITLCETCHDRYHRGEIELKVKRGKPMRDAAAMNMMKTTLYERCKVIFGEDNVSDTWGYITKCIRIDCGLPKEHNVDARVISCNPTARPCDVWHIHQVRRHNRQIHKANKLKGDKLKPNQAPYLVHGFRLNDIVKYKGELYFIGGRRSSGSFELRPLYGDGKKVNPSYKKLHLVCVCNRRMIYKTSFGVSSHD
jgi:N6-L-threonylcarbamoyladenine synthase